MKTQPMSVGVAPGTVTMLLTGPTAPPESTAVSVVGCENPARVRRQRYLLYPPGKFVRGMKAAVTRTASRVRRALDPYETIESLKGTLGIVLAPYGNRTPDPSYEMVAATKTRVYCTRRPERGPGYREHETLAYDPEGRSHGINGLGAVPTDLQLMNTFTYTPVMSQWIPFQQGGWSPAPWTPPNGVASDAPQNRGWTTPLAGLDATTTTVPTAPNAPVDPATAAVNELRRHQDRMYLLGIVSAAAVASTAVINMFRFSQERKASRTAMSGAKRRRRRK